VSRSIALLALAGVLALVGCDKKKNPSEEPTTGSEPVSEGGVVVEEPGADPETPADGVDPVADKGDLEYEGTVEVVAGGTVPCTTDADCVPQECCHPSTCGAPSSKPDCSATMCTLECKSGTMDCFGGCLCGEDKKCAAKIWTATGG
jgi:hypothetical protein